MTIVISEMWLPLNSPDSMKDVCMDCVILSASVLYLGWRGARTPHARLTLGSRSAHARLSRQASAFPNSMIGLASGFSNDFGKIGIITIQCLFNLKFEMSVSNSLWWELRFQPIRAQFRVRRSLFRGSVKPICLRTEDWLCCIAPPRNRARSLVVHPSFFFRKTPKAMRWKLWKDMQEGDAHYFFHIKSDYWNSK